MITTITGTLIEATGELAEGTAVVHWPAFTVAGNSIAGGHKSFDVVAGFLSVSLYANAPAQPSGVYYTVRFELQSGPVYEEYWIVPDSPSATIEQVRVGFPAEPGMLISPWQLSGGGAAPGMILTWNGSQWVGSWVTIENINPNFIGMIADSAGSDFTISGSPAALGTTVTFHLPDASPTARGLVTTGDQSFAGSKEFLGNVTVDGGLIVFGAAGMGPISSPTIVDLDTRITTLESGTANATPMTRRIDTGLGLTGGGDLSADRMLAVVEDSVVEQLRFYDGATLAATRPGLQLFSENTVLTITMSDDPGGNRARATFHLAPLVPDVLPGGAAGAGWLQTKSLPDGNWGSFAPGSPGQILTVDPASVYQLAWKDAPATGSAQTPWTQEIDAAGYGLADAGLIVATRVDAGEFHGSGKFLTQLQVLEVSQAGVVQGLRQKMNFIAGANVTLSVVDNTGTQAMDVTIAGTGGGSGPPAFIDFSVNSNVIVTTWGEV